jgi:hypothetical protein
MYPLAGFCAAVDIQQENFRTARAGSANHTFGKTELHHTRLQIRHTNNQSACQLLRLISLRDARKNILRNAAYIEFQMQELIRTLNGLCL